MFAKALIPSRAAVLVSRSFPLTSVRHSLIALALVPPALVVRQALTLLGHCVWDCFCGLLLGFPLSDKVPALFFRLSFVDKRIGWSVKIDDIIGKYFNRIGHSITVARALGKDSVVRFLARRLVAIA